MSDETLFKIDGEVERPTSPTLSDLMNIDAEYQIADVSEIDPKRKGGAVTLAGLLQFVGVKPSATHLSLHASLDDFHASLPLAPVLEKGIVIYQLDGAPLSTKAGGPIRFYIRDFAACHTDEIDECANVKFVDHIELTIGKGSDNRPEDDKEHEKLHREQG